MEKAADYANQHGAARPVLSPEDVTVLDGVVPVKELQAEGFRIVPWTTNAPEKMHALIRMGVNGIITDRPDLLQAVLREVRALATPAERERLANFDVSAHRGGRGLRPENTLPSFESGLDQLSTALETDTGVTMDGVSLIWHEQFLDPKSCRRVDSAPYTLENRVFIKDISITEAQKTFICDKLHFGPEQKNDLALSPVSVAFAKKEGLISPYVPTYVAQLFRFVNFYVDHYTSGVGKGDADAKERAANAARVRFNLETKIVPQGITTDEGHENHTVKPQPFVDALCGAITQNGMESRAAVLSFDFRTLLLVAQHHPSIRTYYLTGEPAWLSSALVPEPLRAIAEGQ